MSDLLVMKRTSFSNQDLDALVIHNKHQSEDDWKKVESYIFSNKNIQVIELSGVNISSFGLLSLAEIIKKST